jgi:transposase
MVHRGMARPYPGDFRERVVEARRAGASAGEIARILRISPRTIYRWEARLRAGESLAPRPKSGRPSCLSASELKQIDTVVRDRPDATLAEYCAAWHALSGRSISLSTMGKTINRLGLRRKKRV